MHNTNENSRIIGFDFGLKRIGTATGNTRTGTSQALSVLPAKNGTPQWTEVARLIAQWLPSTLVVGIPVGRDGGENAMTARIRKFGKLMRQRFALEVVFVDERLTTASADTLLRQTTAAGKSLNQRRLKFRDSLAAELIVQTYLEDNRN